MQDTVRTVLVIEDEDAVRHLLRTMLRLAGYEALSCRDGDEALDLMEARGGTVHLLITDLNLGNGPDGFEIAGKLRERQPSLKVLFISGEDEGGRAMRDREPGSSEDFFLPKPFTPKAFGAAVAGLLGPVRTNAVS